MSFFTKAALVASAGLAMAAPAENIMARSTFQLNQVSTGKVLKSGPLAMMKTYNKYAAHGAVAPSEVKAAAAAVQSGSAPANPESVCLTSHGVYTADIFADTHSSTTSPTLSRSPLAVRPSTSTSTPEALICTLSNRSNTVAMTHETNAIIQLGLLYRDSEQRVHRPCQVQSVYLRQEAQRPDLGHLLR